MDEFDIVVIGGGSGGSAAAGRLSEDGKYSVCLIEAGGRNTDIRVRAPGLFPFLPASTNWQFETVPQPGLNGRTGYQPRGRGLGGSSAINAMVYIRGCAWDYDNWAALGCDGWAYKDVLPIFRRAESNVRGADDFHGGDGPLTVSDQTHPNPGSVDFVEAAASLQLPRNPDFNGARFEGVGLYQVTQRKGERWTSARAYVEGNRDAGRLRVENGALVERVLIEDGRATGVVFMQGGKRRTVRARRAVILAGGVFGTAQLLLLSGIGPADHLREHGIPVVVDRPSVGENLQDHIDYVAGFETGGTVFTGTNLRTIFRTAGALWEWIRKRTGPMTTNYAEAGGFAKSSPEVAVPDLQFHFVPAILEDHGREKVKEAGFSGHVCVLRPESRGTVRLASADPAAAPLIDPGFLTDSRDMEIMKKGVRMLHRILTSPPLSQHGGKDRHATPLDDDAALEQMIRNRADTVYHPVGTARMGSDDDAVCDPQLRVRGVEGLYVADASVMPRLVSGNTNAPSIMIGERCADFVKADLR
ncbi:MAG: GMC family oxidoreductase N-terminal domain-containing protein [Sphingomonadales bacterium]|nr:GMC family oxidoreductase N-terminal domain-containing protein [Sphingomonadales bacterium]